MWNNDEITKARAIVQAQERQRQLEAYNNQKAQLDNQYNNGGLGGFLGGIVGGIGKGIADIGKGTLGVIGGGAAAVKDLVEGKAGSMENQNAFKRWLYDAETDKDASAKAAGTALNAATTLATTAIPGLGAGSTAAKALGGVTANTIGGAVGGVADEFQQQGANANLESAINRGISGAVAGAATGGLNKKIGNATGNLSSKLLNNKLATSTLGRGALSGAVGGATGAGTSAALGGGDIAQAALQGGLSGAVSGATQAGVMAGANRALQGVKSRLGVNNQTQNIANVVSDNATTDDGLDIPDYTTPKDWSGKEIKLDKKGSIGSVGDKLVNASKAIKDQDVYNALYSKTAEKVINNNSIERLRELGFEPKDYGDAAKVSTAVNKFLDDVVAGSNAKYADSGFIDRLSDIQNSANLGTTAVEKKFNHEIGSLISRLEKGAAPGEYDVKTLVDESRYFKKLASTEYKNGVDVNGGDKGNYRKDLGEAFSQVANDLRSMADAGMGGLGDNYTKSQLTQMLQKLKAPQATIDYLTDFNSLPEAINKTSILEDGRQMNKELNTTKVRRNATAGDSGKLLNRIANKSGLTEVTNLVAEPLGKASGKVLETVGKGLQRVDGAISSSNLGTTSNGTPVQPISQNTQNILGNLIGRTEGIAQADNLVQNARKAQDYQNLEDMFGGNPNFDTSLTNTLTGATQAKSQAQLQSEAQLADIANGMQLALAAGDIASYNKLEDLYQSAYKMYQLQYPTQESTESKMTTAEKNQLAKLESAGTALDQLESLYTKAGGGQGIIGGNIANFLGGLGLNSDVNTYNQLAQGLINQIGAAIGKTDSLNTEGEVQRALSLVPKITDDNQTAMNKLATLRQLLQTNTGTYNELYGA